MTYNLRDGVFGETYNKVSFLFPFSLTGTTIKMFVFSQSTSIAEYTIANKLEIDASESKRLIIKEHIIDIKPSTYIYKIKITREGKIRTYLTGNWVIKK